MVFLVARRSPHPEFPRCFLPLKKEWRKYSICLARFDSNQDLARVFFNVSPGFPPLSSSPLFPPSPYFCVAPFMHDGRCWQSAAVSCPGTTRTGACCRGEATPPRGQGAPSLRPKPLQQYSRPRFNDALGFEFWKCPNPGKFPSVSGFLCPGHDFSETLSVSSKRGRLYSIPTVRSSAVRRSVRVPLRSFGRSRRDKYKTSACGCAMM